MSLSSAPTPQAEPAATPKLDWRGCAWAVLVVAVTTLLGWLLFHGLHWPDDSRKPPISNTNVLMIYLLAVLGVSTRLSRQAAIVASILGVIAFDVCFTEPYLHITVNDEQYFITFGVMLLTALVISTLTHRVRAQAEANRQAWERERVRNTLLSGVCHDLRTPLAIIAGTVNTLIESHDALPKQSADEMLAMTHSEAERMERIITNLLGMTRLESGRLTVRREWQPIAEVVGSTLRHLGKRLDGREVHTDLPADLPMVSFDAVAIEQVLTNLIDNAVEYTAAGTPIDISARMTPAGLKVAVADHGEGLSQEGLKRVFEKFYRGRPTGGADRGIGLGLAICKGIVEAHGGTIAASNRKDGGAVFEFTLPAGAAPAVDASQ